MKVYLDYMFLENLLVNYIVLYVVNIFTKSENKKIYLLISSIILSIYITISSILNLKIIEDIILRILVVNFTLYIAYFSNNLKEYLKKQIYYYLIYFMYVGIVISITLFFDINLKNVLLKILVYLISGIILYIFNKFLWKMWKTNIKNDKLTYNLLIDGQEIPCFIDTGSNVYDFVNNLDVIFLDKMWYEVLLDKRLLKETTNIAIRTVATEDFITGYILKDVQITKRKKTICNLKRVVVSFPPQTINILGRCSGIIGYNLYIEKMKGVIL